MRRKEKQKAEKRKRRRGKMIRKVCKKCRIFVEGQKCPLCGGEQLTESWKGRVYVFNPEESEIAKNMKVTKKGIYAIKTR